MSWDIIRHEWQKMEQDHECLKDEHMKFVLRTDGEGKLMKGFEEGHHMVWVMGELNDC